MPRWARAGFTNGTDPPTVAAVSSAAVLSTTGAGWSPVMGWLFVEMGWSQALREQPTASSNAARQRFISGNRLIARSTGWPAQSWKLREGQPGTCRWAALFARVSTSCGMLRAAFAVAGTLGVRRCLITSRHLSVLTVSTSGRILSHLLTGESGSHKKAPLLCGKRVFVD